ncbi:MAG: hypothetical protein HW393_585 [Dehalococcoidia bacterium]|nr:hypothetical protein [Dehalococcoidia bacterium]
MSPVTAQPRPRHVPRRTCVSCGSTTSKRDLVRLVRTPASVEPDPTGKRPGRGAYLCHNPDCWESAVRKSRLEHALRTKLTPADREALLSYRAEQLEAKTS